MKWVTEATEFEGHAMSDGVYGVLGRVQRLLREGTASGLTECQLLQRYVTRRDDAAFEALLLRHGPMVLGVCRRMLNDPRDVEDAFQATFLVLVRRAESLRGSDVLGPWLHGVASRVALRARADTSRRRRREPLELEGTLAPAAAGEDPARSELVAVIDEECRRLPARYSAPIVLCHLEGLTYEEAAQRLGCPVNTVKGRLARGRGLLRSRLARRGLVPTAVVLTAALEHEAKAAISESLVRSTSHAVRCFVSQSAVATGATSASALAEGVLAMMFFQRVKVTAAWLLTVGLFAAVTAALVSRASGRDDAGAVKVLAQRSAPKAAANKPDGPGSAYPVKLRPEEVYEYPALSITHRKFQLKSGPVLVVPMACERGVTGVMVIGNGTFSFSPEGGKPIEGSFRSAMLRFNPDDEGSLIALDKGKKVTDQGAYEMSRHLMSRVFGHCWHKGNDALLPPPAALAVVLYSKEHGDLLISDDGKQVVAHNFTKNQTLYEGK